MVCLLASLFLTANAWTGNVTQLVSAFLTRVIYNKTKPGSPVNIHDVQWNSSCGCMIHSETKPGSPVHTCMTHNGTEPRESCECVSDTLWNKARVSCGWIIHCETELEFPANVCRTYNETATFSCPRKRIPQWHRLAWERSCAVGSRWFCFLQTVPLICKGKSLLHRNGGVLGKVQNSERLEYTKPSETWMAAPFLTH